MNYRLTIERILYGGDGLARIDGKVVFVPYSAPGDVLEVEIVENKSDFLRGRIAEILEPSPERTKPECPCFGQCGGCDFQHMQYQTQTHWKKIFIADALKRIAKISPPREIPFFSASPWAYRNRVQWKFESDRKGLRFGFFQKESNRIVEVAECPILCPALNKVRWQAAERAREAGVRRGEIEAVCDSNETVLFARSAQKDQDLAFTVKSRNLHAGPDSFFQCNRFLLDRLMEEAIGNSSGKLAWDLYAGVGFFSAFLLERFDVVLGVESNKTSQSYFERNAPKARFESGSVEQWIARHTGAKPDLILLDPPRAGLSAPVRNAIAACGASEIVYVSCNPSTLARDIGFFSARGYCLESIAALDLFPQTFHVESVAKLVRTQS